MGPVHAAVQQVEAEPAPPVLVVRPVLELGATKVRPRSSVCTRRARGVTFRIARMASSTPRHWIAATRANFNSSSLRRCGNQWP